MNQVRLQNKEGKISLVGEIVKLAPNSTKAYVLADTPDPDAIGTVAESVPNGYWGLVDLINSVSSLSEEFETVSKNLKAYPYALTYGVDGVATITYDLGGGLSVVKTFNYTLGVLTTIVLSGDTPSGIELTKTFSYTGADLTSVTYS